MKRLPFLFVFICSAVFCKAQITESTPYDVIGALTSKQYKYALSPKQWQGKSTDLKLKHGFKVVDKEIFILSRNESLIPIEDIPKEEIRVLAGDKLFFIVVVADTAISRYYMYHKKKGFVKIIPIE